MVNKWLSRFYLAIMFLFLYAPIAVLIVFSFNESKSSGKWTGFSLQWYEELLQDSQMQTALFYTVIVAVLATAISTIVGTFTSIGIFKLTKKTKAFVLNINYLPVISPDIVLAVALMMLFKTLKMKFGFTTMLLSHIMFCIPYVVLSVLPRLYAMNPNLAEAAMDLGATPMQAIRKVVIPEILPGIMAGALAGNGVTNLSIEVYSMAKRGIRPTVNALATIMVSFILVSVLISNNLSIKKKREV